MFLDLRGSIETERVLVVAGEGVQLLIQRWGTVSVEQGVGGKKGSREKEEKKFGEQDCRWEANLVKKFV